jgi:DNA primase
MRIPENKIEEVRNAANIVDVISEYVSLRKRGKNYLGLCPFHNEKTPSFTVSSEKQIFHCFGCHAGGNVFKFLMDYKKISYVEAIQELADEFGITIEYDEKYVEIQSEQEILYDINTVAAKYFSNNLLSASEGETARKYFAERKLKQQSLRSFGLGYSYSARDSFVKYAKENKLDLDKCIHLGLIGRYDDGNYYDKFSSRIIFPIFSPNGRVVAFAGRIFDDRENWAKYLNSPESSIYHKGKILYGLSHAKDEIRRQNKAILVEGYMDLISLHQSGIKNVVAVSGTALTEDQIQLLSRYTKNVILLFDADNAGIKASMRSIELLLKQEMEVRVISLPKGEDPDSFVNNFGKEKFEELVKSAKNFLEYQTAFYESQGLLEDPMRLTEVIKELVKTLALINDELKRNLLLKSIAKKFNIRENLLEDELEKIINVTNKTAEQKNNVVNEKNAEEKRVRESKKEKVQGENLAIERDLIKLLFEGDKKILGFIASYVTPESLSDETNKEICRKALDEYFAKKDISAAALTEIFPEEEIQDYIYEITFDKYSTSRRWAERNLMDDGKSNLPKQAEDIVKNFLLIKIDERIKDNLQRLAEADNEELVKGLMKIIDELTQSKKEIANIKF